MDPKIRQGAEHRKPQLQAGGLLVLVLDEGRAADPKADAPGPWPRRRSDRAGFGASAPACAGCRCVRGAAMAEWIRFAVPVAARIKGKPSLVFAYRAEQDCAGAGPLWAEYLAALNPEHHGHLNVVSGDGVQLYRRTADETAAELTLDLTQRALAGVDA